MRQLEVLLRRRIVSLAAEPVEQPFAQCGQGQEEGCAPRFRQTPHLEDELSLEGRLERVPVARVAMRGSDEQSSNLPFSRHTYADGTSEPVRSLLVLEDAPFDLTRRGRGPTLLVGKE